MNITIFIDGEPDPNSRPRVVRRGSKIGMIQHKKNWHYAILQECAKHVKGAPIDAPLEVIISCYFPRPKLHYNKKGLKPNAPNYYDKKPDNDNIEKTVFDAIVKSGLIRDDSRICENHTRKRYSENPNTIIEIRTLGE